LKINGERTKNPAILKLSKIKSTTKEEIRDWFLDGLKKKATHMIIVCDTFDWTDYPVYVSKKQKSIDVFMKYENRDMQKVMEVYDLALDMEAQLNAKRVFNL